MGWPDREGSVATALVTTTDISNPTVGSIWSHRLGTLAIASSNRKGKNWSTFSWSFSHFWCLDLGISSVTYLQDDCHHLSIEVHFTESVSIITLIGDSPE